MSKLLFHPCPQNQPARWVKSQTGRSIFRYLLVVTCLAVVVFSCTRPVSAQSNWPFFRGDKIHGVSLNGEGGVDAVVEDLNGDVYLFVFGPGGNTDLIEFYVFAVDDEGNPSPETGETGLAPDQETIENMLKKLTEGVAGIDRDPLNNWLIQNLIDQGKIPGGAIDPWELGGFMMENPNGGGLPGGFDLGMPLSEIINQLKRSGSSGGSDNENLDYEVPPSYGTTGLEDFGPSIPWVNPIPDLDVLQNTRVTERSLIRRPPGRGRGRNCPRSTFSFHLFFSTFPLFPFPIPLVNTFQSRRSRCPSLTRTRPVMSNTTLFILQGTYRCRNFSSIHVHKIKSSTLLESSMKNAA